MTALSPSIKALIEALAERAVQDYLGSRAASHLASEATRPERVPLPTMHQAA